MSEESGRCVYLILSVDGHPLRVFDSRDAAETYEKRSPYDHLIRPFRVTEKAPERIDWWHATWSSRKGIEEPWPSVRWSDEDAEETSDPAISQNRIRISVASTDRDRAVALLAELVAAREAEDVERDRAEREAHRKRVEEWAARDAEEGA